MEDRRHELLRDVEDAAAATAVDFGVDQATARMIGCAVADMLLERWAGQQITFPMGRFYRLSPKELAIVEDRDQGLRVFELAKKYFMSERGIRKLLKRADEGRTRATAQLGLFDALPAGAPRS